MARRNNIVLLLGAALAPPWRRRQPRADALGELLPRGAVARLGTARLLHGESTLNGRVAVGRGRARGDGVDPGPVRRMKGIQP